jgi:hypothetical protein
LFFFSLLLRDFVLTVVCFVIRNCSLGQVLLICMLSLLLYFKPLGHIIELTHRYRQEKFKSANESGMSRV